MFSTGFLRKLPTNTYKHLLLVGSGKIKMANSHVGSNANFSEIRKPSNKFMPVTHVIFDLDGLILDTESIYKQIISEIADYYGKKYTKEIQLKVLGTTEQRTSQIVVKECELPITADEFLYKFQKMQLVCLANAKLKEGAEQLIKHLSKNKVPIAVASSSAQKPFEVKIKAHKPLFDLFHHIVLGSSDPEVKQGKPAPDIFKVCAQRFSDQPEYHKCLVFEDAPNGVQGAVAAGMQAIIVPDIILPPEKTSHATLIINSLLDFVPEAFGLPPYK